MGLAEAVGWYTEHGSEESDRDVVPCFDVAEDALFRVKPMS